MQYGAVIIVILVAMFFVVKRGRAFRASGEADERIWFYDQSGHRLYAVPADTLPPDDAVGGEFGDGVRAVVVAFKKNERDLRQLKIAYLESYTPELKGTLSKILAAQAAHKNYDGPVPARNSPYFQTNDLVKRLDETNWYAASSSEGQKIMSEWRSWRGPEGQRPLVSEP